jgi:hypothetical protein
MIGHFGDELGPNPMHSRPTQLMAATFQIVAVTLANKMVRMACAVTPVCHPAEDRVLG